MYGILGLLIEIKDHYGWNVVMLIYIINISPLIQWWKAKPIRIHCDIKIKPKCQSKCLKDFLP